MTTKQIFELLAKVFPDETLQRGQRLKLNQVEVLNAIALELKARRASTP